MIETTKNETRRVILASDRALAINDPNRTEKASQEELQTMFSSYDDYRKTGNEEVLKLVSDPIRFEIRPLAWREYLAITGRITHRNDIDPVNIHSIISLTNLDMVKAGLVAIWKTNETPLDGASREELDKNRIYLSGINYITDTYMEQLFEYDLSTIKQLADFICYLTVGERTQANGFFRRNN